MYPAHSASPTIVCVDDDLPLLHGLREQLLRGLDRSCEVELATSGAEALQLLGELAAQRVQVPLIICDQLMPGMRGSDVLAQAHRLYPDMLTVLLTGQADLAAVGEAINRANLYRLLTKPWQADDLILTVREALRRWEQDRALALRSTELAAANDHLEDSLQVLQATMNATLDGLLVTDGDGHPVRINHRMAEIWSLPQSALAAGCPDGLVEHLQAQLLGPSVLTLAADGEPRRPTLLALNGERWVEFAGRPFDLQGQPAGAVYSFRDVTERERHGRQIQHQALHDNLSGLPNRLQFGQTLEQALEQARATGTQLAVMFVDLDHFKRINDRLGHEFGDRLLQYAAQRLSASVSAHDMVARWGGDEFTVLLRETQGPQHVSEVAERLLRRIEEPFGIDDMSLRMSASIGIASFPGDGQDGQTLLRRADMALYRAKDDGRNGFHVFRESAFGDLDPHHDVALEAELFHTVERGQLQLHYQPQIDVDSGAVVAVEALARWHHPVHGWVPPGVFIPMAERTGSIAGIGMWVLHEACRQAAAWRAEGLGDVQVAVNLSPGQVMRGQLRATVHQALAQSGLPAGLLELEVTEAAGLRHLEPAAASLAELRRDGVRVALDDFGTGYSSLTYLKHLPCDTLKIDRSFIEGVAAGGTDAAIVRGLVAIAAGLHLRLVAEGIETPATAQRAAHARMRRDAGLPLLPAGPGGRDRRIAAATADGGPSDGGLVRRGAAVPILRPPLASVRFTRRGLAGRRQARVLPARSQDRTRRCGEARTAPIESASASIGLFPAPARPNGWQRICAD